MRARLAARPQSYGVDAAFMLLLRHGWGIHVVTGLVLAVPEGLEGMRLARGRKNGGRGWAGSGHHRRVGDTFVPGLRLAGEFYAEAVRPLLEAEFPGLG